MLQRFSKLVVLLALLGCASCVDDNTSFYISAHVSGNQSGGSCTYEPGNAVIATGLYDPSVANAYVLHPLYNNALMDRSSFLSTDPNGVFITSAVVEIQTFDGATVAFGAGPNPFEVSTSTYVPSSESEGEVSQAVGNIVVIPPAYGLELGGSGLAGVMVVVRVLGETNGQTDIESDDFYWPITFASLGAVCGDSEQIPCNAGQDEAWVISCCTSAADCDDSNECTTDTCGGVAGCSNTPVTDGTTCTGGTCTGGVCM